MKLALTPKPRFSAVFLSILSDLGPQNLNVGEPGIPRNTPKDAFVSRHRFLSIFSGFLVPPGTDVEVVVGSFLWFGVPKW